MLYINFINMSSKNSGKSHKKKNKDAVQFILANREINDPNYNNPKATDKILLQLNKDEDLTSEQKKIIESIPKIQRGVFDEEDRIKQMLEAEQQSKEKKVKFDFMNSEIIPFDKKGKVEQIQIEEEIDTGKPHTTKKINKQPHHNPKKIEFNDIDQENKYIDELFKRVKINAKVVEYNELGLKKDTPPEIMQFVTNKEFKEGVDIFIPAPVITEEALHIYDNDMKEEEMNDEYKEVEKELKSDSEKDDKDKNEENDNNLLEDNFILLANGGELPIEYIGEQNDNSKEETKDNGESIQPKQENTNKKAPSYKYITKEEIEYLNKKFAEEDKKKGKYDRPNGYVGKEEFNDAIEEMLNTKKEKGVKEKKQIMGLAKTIEDDDEYEEYEFDEEDEDNSYNEEDESGAEDKEDNEEDNKKENEGYVPKITFEYVNKEDEPDPFDKDNNKKSSKQTKKLKKKSKSKQYEEQKKLPQDERDSDYQEDSFTIDDLNKLTSDKNFVEKTIELYQHEEERESKEGENIEKIEEEIEKKFIHEPKVRKDITSAQPKMGNLPKSVKEVKKQKDFEKRKKMNQEEPESIQKNVQDESVKHNLKKEIESKEEKKLRKKLLKMEKKEKRIENKKVKLAFKEEKKHQQRQIAEANKVIRCGLSVKDI